MTIVSKRLTAVIIWAVLVLALNACQKQQPSITVKSEPIQILGPANPYQVVPTIESTPTPTSALWTNEDSRLDSQGAVEIEIIPPDLNLSRETLDFNVSLNTHSVDLSMDLIPLITLETDTGHRIKPLTWDGPSGGHHLSGILSFPAVLNGTSVLEGVTRLEIIIENIDAQERVFIWEQ
jgi:hypothetical protein